MPLVKFVDFELDPYTGELWHHGVRSHLQEQPLKVLVCLLERPGKVVTREELRRRVWGEGIHVNFEDGLNTAVSKLRQALEEDADHPLLVETLPRKGYRFTAAVAEEPSGQMPGLKLRGDRRTSIGGTATVSEPSPGTLPPPHIRRSRAARLLDFLRRHFLWLLGVMGGGTWA
ncbi:MAG TPA: winged helix-turn-helix domain-containing protein [Holophagaceae bacterium]|nr:winged helix-turn-helix domain-containing protein [Holophagaceae bacterium]